MSLSLHTASVPVFQQMLGSLDQLLEKAEAHATARKIEPDALLLARLSPDMFPLVRQVQIACDFAKGVCGRLAQVDLPVNEDSERGFGELRQRIAGTLDFIASLPPEAFEGAGEREIVLRPGTPKERRLPGQAYLLHYGLPQFFFHHAMCYALLRHNGMEIGKRDFMGSY